MLCPYTEGTSELTSWVANHRWLHLNPRVSMYTRYMCIPWFSLFHLSFSHIPQYHPTKKMKVETQVGHCYIAKD